MNINKDQKLFKLRKKHLIMKQNIYKSFWKKYGLPLQVCINNWN